MNISLEKFAQFCRKCETVYSSQKRIDKCQCSNNLEFFIQSGDFLKDIQDKKSMWRFANLLPVSERSIISAGEGNTPIIYLEDLGKKLGIELYVKLETENPSGTFKDREASFVVSRSKEIGQDNLVLQSTGNTGMAISYYAGLADLNSFFFGPLISSYKLAMPKRTGKNKIILVDGSPEDVKRIASEFSKINGFNKISPFHERCECNATIGYEVAEKILKNEAPGFDHYVQTIAAGMGPIGFYLGMTRASEWTGKIKIPRISAVQIEDFSPCQKAWKEGKEEMDENVVLDSNSYEPTLHTTNAKAYYKPLTSAINRTNGTMVVVSRDEADFYSIEFRDALEKQGYELSDTEKAGFIGYAGLRKNITEGVIKKRSNVLFLFTGKGKKGERIGPDLIIGRDENVKGLLEKLQ